MISTLSSVILLVVCAILKLSRGGLRKAPAPPPPLRPPWFQEANKPGLNRSERWEVTALLRKTKFVNLKL